MKYLPFNRLALPLACSLFASQACFGEVASLAQDTRQVNGETLTFTKYLDKEGNPALVVKNQKGEILDSEFVFTSEGESIKAPVISNAVRAELKRAARPDETLKVKISFAEPQYPNTEADSTGSFDSKTGTYSIDGSQFRDAEMEFLLKERTNDRLYRAALRKVARGNVMKRWAEKMGVKAEEEINIALERDINSIELQIPAGKMREVINKIETARDFDVVSIDVAPKGGPTIAGAMAYSNVDPRALGSSIFRGADIGIFVTEWEGCPNPGFVSNYTRLNGTNHWHGEWVVGIARAVSPNSYIYCAGNPRLPTIAELAGSGGNPPIRVVNASFAWYTTHGEYTTTDRDWDNFAYNNDISIFVSAGNSNSSTGQSVTTPGKGLNILTVGNVNDATATMASDSLYLDPQTKNEKPEITAPGTSISAGGYIASGTSASAPHAAGMAADYLDEVVGARDRPYMLRSLMLATATHIETGNAGGADSTGVGGMNFLNDASSYSWHFHFWDGGNGYFNSSTNPYYDGGIYNVLTYNLAAGEKVTAAIAWNNRGTYTFDHRTDAYPMGLDFDLQIYDPSFNLVGTSHSFHNPYEVVSFTAPASGTYTVRINRFANRDTSGRYELGFTMFRR